MITSPCGTEGPKGVVPPCVNLYKVNHGTRTSHSGVQRTYQQTIPSHIHVCPYTCPYTGVRTRVSVHVSILLKHVYLYCAITCGMMVSRERKSCSPRVAMSTPSMVIFPPAPSRIRNKANVNDDFPAPVRPTMPIC